MKETDKEIKFADLPSAGIWKDRDVNEILEELGRGWRGFGVDSWETEESPRISGAK